MWSWMNIHRTWWNTRFQLDCMCLGGNFKSTVFFFAFLVVFFSRCNVFRCELLTPWIWHHVFCERIYSISDKTCIIWVKHAIFEYLSKALLFFCARLKHILLVWVRHVNQSCPCLEWLQVHISLRDFGQAMVIVGGWGWWWPSIMTHQRLNTNEPVTKTPLCLCDQRFHG